MSRDSDQRASGCDQLTAAQHFLSGCASAGLRRVVLSPGSRSTPLALAANRQSALLPLAVHLDERSAAFSALGEAKATGEPVALVCTSGTATANYLPAIAEAGMAGVPLVVVTADRPPEHISWGVGQSFVQSGLYAAQVRDAISMPVGGDGGAAHAGRAGLRATLTAIEQAGPVHVNWPFRLPLEPSDDQLPEPPVLHAAASVRSDAGVTSSTAVEELADLVRNARRGVIVAGPTTARGSTAHAQRSAILEFAHRAGFPVVADVLSGLRGAEAAPLLDLGGLVLDRGDLETDLIIRIGDTPTAKATRLWWERRTDAAQVLLDPARRWHDPSHTATHVYGDPVASLLTEAASRLDDEASESTRRWTGELLEAGMQARRVADAILDRSDSWTEAHVARSLGSVSPSSTIVASSSMPVRDLDTFTSANTRSDVLSNRGINGIDGVVATAIGVSRASPKRVVVHIGDVALLHDVGSVLDAVRQQSSLTIVMVNNDGGGIFSFLPVRQVIDSTEFRRLFHTPHGTDFSSLAAFEGVDHRRVDASNLEDALASTASPGVQILEAVVQTSDHLDIHSELATELDSLLGDLSSDGR